MALDALLPSCHLNARAGFWGNKTKVAPALMGSIQEPLFDGVRPFEGASRQQFYDRLYGRVINNSGHTAQTSGRISWRIFLTGRLRADPGQRRQAIPEGDDLACRQSYHILMTDGFWNGAGPDVGNSDNTNGPTYTDQDGGDYGYVASDPFRDSRSNTLADVAMEVLEK